MGRILLTGGADAGSAASGGWAIATRSTTAGQVSDGLVVLTHAGVYRDEQSDLDPRRERPRAPGSCARSRDRRRVACARSGQQQGVGGRRGDRELDVGVLGGGVVEHQVREHGGGMSREDAMSARRETGHRYPPPFGRVGIECWHAVSYTHLTLP